MTVSILGSMSSDCAVFVYLRQVTRIGQMVGEVKDRGKTSIVSGLHLTEPWKQFIHGL